MYVLHFHEFPDKFAWPGGKQWTCRQIYSIIDCSVSDVSFQISRGFIYFRSIVCAKATSRCAGRNVDRTRANRCPGHNVETKYELPNLQGLQNSTRLETTFYLWKIYFYIEQAV